MSVTETMTDTQTLASASDAEGNAITITGQLQGGAALPGFITILTQTQIYVNPAIGDFGTYKVEVILTDNNNAPKSTVYPIIVDIPEINPNAPSLAIAQKINLSM